MLNNTQQTNNYMHSYINPNVPKGKMVEGDKG